MQILALRWPQDQLNWPFHHFIWEILCLLHPLSPELALVQGLEEGIVVGTAALTRLSEPSLYTHPFLEDKFRSMTVDPNQVQVIQEIEPPTKLIGEKNPIGMANEFCPVLWENQTFV